MTPLKQIAALYVETKGCYYGLPAVDPWDIKRDARLPQRRLSERGYESARRAGMVAYQSSQARQRTPIPFRDLLIDLVRTMLIRLTPNGAR